VPVANNDDNIALLDSLIREWENETVEFKEASTDFDTNRIGQYVSALSNEANLHEIPSSWLVFGVNNRTRTVVGTGYRPDGEQLESLKHQILCGTQPSLTFRTIRVVNHANGRVILFEIPAAPQGLPVSWQGHYYARAGESLIPLSIDKQDSIRRQDSLLDWTAQTVADAELTDLLPKAVDVARQAFAQKNSSRIPKETISSWSDEELLTHLGLITKHGITRAALLLLGKPESVYLLGPSMAELTWKLVGQDVAYEHFSIPFILATTELYTKIRNVQIRLLPLNELVQREVEKYDQASVLEAMHNCIAHQDYSMHSRISVTEFPDRLEFLNAGSFFEGTPDDYAVSGHIPNQYRNPTLVRAMTQLNMIDHLGFGIERINHSQASRYLPLPDYDLSNPKEVKLTIYGSVVDQSYTRMLMTYGNLPFEDILALDRIQKNRPIPDNALRRLRRKGLVEGRRPHVRVAASIAAVTGTQARYIQSRGQSDEYCEALITDYLKKNGAATRKDFDRIVCPSLSVEMTPEQKSNKVGNLLGSMRRRGIIIYGKNDGISAWTLT
jgi:ATP-dependent DNA helicase RecG